MYRLEIVTRREGLEHFVWNFFPRLTPSSFSESFCIYACSAEGPLTDIQITLLDNWCEEEIIFAYQLSENDRPILKSHITPVAAQKVSGYSSEYWRKQAWLGKVPGAMKEGKQWLLPRTFVEQHMKPVERVDVVGMYIIKASGPGPSYVQIGPTSNPVDLRNHMHLNTEQETAYQQAIACVKRGDKDAAMEALKSVFEKVWREE